MTESCTARRLHLLGCLGGLALLAGCTETHLLGDSALASVCTTQPDSLVGLLDATTDWQLVSIEATSATTTNIGAIPSLPGILGGGTSIDARSNRVYQVSGDQVLHTIDATTGAVIGVAPLAGPAMLVRETTHDGQLLAITAGLAAPKLVIIDPTSGAFSAIGDVQSLGFLNEGVQAFDATRSRLYFVGGVGSDLFLMTLDTQTAAMIHRVPIPSSLAILEVTASGTLIALDMNDGVDVSVLDATSGSKQLLTHIPAIKGVQSASATIDRTANKIYGMGLAENGSDNVLFTIDASTGALLSSVTTTSRLTALVMAYSASRYAECHAADGGVPDAVPTGRACGSLTFVTDARHRRDGVLPRDERRRLPLAPPCERTSAHLSP